VPESSCSSELPGSGLPNFGFAPQPSSRYETASLQALKNDWAAINVMSLWLFQASAEIEMAEVTDTYGPLPGGDTVVK